MVDVLVADGAKLTLTSDASGWCRLDLACAGRSFELGAESRSVVVERLLSGLRHEPNAKPSGRIEGVDVSWVLSLAERHASVYVGRQRGKCVLFFENAEGGLMARVELDDVDRSRWIAQLER